MWQFWASETLQKRLSNASVTLQKRSTSGLHVLLDVFIHCGRFHGQGARRCGALLARVDLGVSQIYFDLFPRSGQNLFILVVESIYFGSQYL